MTTVCAKCGNLFVVNKNDPWWRWLCIKAPIQQQFNPVTGLTVADPPYRLCKLLNYGDCEMFEVGPNSLKSREDLVSETERTT